MKAGLVAAVAAASVEAALGFAPVAPAAPRSGVLALRAQVRFRAARPQRVLLVAAGAVLRGAVPLPAARRGRRPLTRRTPPCRTRR